VAQIQEAFCAVDLDKDGIIAAKDLESVLRFF
jgi:Ca2+-binding EF-hand superfamily protein